MTKRATTPNEKPAAKFTRLLLVEDHPLVRRGIIDMVHREPDLRVAGEAATPAEAMAILAGGDIDLILADLSLKEGSGIDLVRQIRTQGLDVPILIVSMREETLFAERAIRAGAQGYVSKSAPSEQLILAIRQVLRGEIALSQEVTKRLVRRAAGVHATSRQGVPIFETLSDRELEIFEMFGRGYSVADIAERLGISVKTVQAHREHIKEKLELGTSAELTRYATLWTDGGSIGC